LSLHDALPIYLDLPTGGALGAGRGVGSVQTPRGLVQRRDDVTGRLRIGGLPAARLEVRTPRETVPAREPAGARRVLSALEPLERRQQMRPVHRVHGVPGALAPQLLEGHRIEQR